MQLYQVSHVGVVASGPLVRRDYTQMVDDGDKYPPRIFDLGEV